MLNYQIESRIDALVQQLSLQEKELKGFAKIVLAPGEQKIVTFTLDPRALSDCHSQRGGWIADPGIFDILVGASSRNIRLQSQITLAKKGLSHDRSCYLS